MWALTSRPQATELFSNMIIFQHVFIQNVRLTLFSCPRKHGAQNTLWHLRLSVFHSRHPLSALRVRKVQVSARFCDASFPSAVYSHSRRKPLTWLFIPMNKDTGPCLSCQSSCKSFRFFFFWSSGGELWWQWCLMARPGLLWGDEGGVTVRIWGGGHIGDRSGRGRARLAAS